MRKKTGQAVTHRSVLAAGGAGAAAGPYPARPGSCSSPASRSGAGSFGPSPARPTPPRRTPLPRHRTSAGSGATRPRARWTRAHTPGAHAEHTPLAPVPRMWLDFREVIESCVKSHGPLLSQEEETTGGGSRGRSWGKAPLLTPRSRTSGPENCEKSLCR